MGLLDAYGLTFAHYFIAHSLIADISRVTRFKIRSMVKYIVFSYAFGAIFGKVLHYQG